MREKNKKIVQYCAVNFLTIKKKKKIENVFGKIVNFRPPRKFYFHFFVFLFFARVYRSNRYF